MTSARARRRVDRVGGRPACPRTRFPVAADDGLAAVRWVAAHAADLGGLPGALVLAGWSAGANLAAVTCQQVLAHGGLLIAGQLLLALVTDGRMTSPSYPENAEGYGLTAALMGGFWGHCADPADGLHPKASPLHGATPVGLPPACVVACDVDPLRGEGLAYASALAAAGVAVQQIRGRGHSHTSLTMVVVVLSGAPVRAEMAGALKRLVQTTRPA